MSGYARHLLFHGVLLFLFGLLNGLVVQRLYNPRMGLSSHLAGVQNALVLIAFGLLWVHANPPLPAVTFWTSLYGMYGIWLALLLAAMWGTSRSTPIAGAGFTTAAAWQETTVTALIISGSVAIIVATVLLLIGLYQQLGKP